MKTTNKVGKVVSVLEVKEDTDVVVIHTEAGSSALRPPRSARPGGPCKAYAS